jgi:hypothetical protein
MAQQLKTRGQAPSKGLYVSSMSDMIPPEYTPWCQNVRFRFGEVLRAPGRSIVLDSHPTKSILDFAIHTDSTGLKTVVALIADSLFLNRNEVQAVDTVNSLYNLVGTPVAIADSIQDVRFSWTQGEERLFVVRRSHVAAIQTGSGVVTSVELFGPGTPICSFVEYFSNRLFALNTSDSSNRVQYTALSHYDDWVPVAPEHGGFIDLYDGSVTAITGGKCLNSKLVVYKEDMIIDLASTGDQNVPFLPETRVNGIGCMFPWTLQSAGQFHIFVGNDYMVYIWDGVQLTPIGQPVHSYIRRLLDRMQDPWYNIPFGAMFKGFKEYYLVLQSEAMNYREVLIYDYMRGSWTRDYFMVDVDRPFGGLWEVSEVGAAGTPGYSATDYPLHYPLLVASKDKDIFTIDERIAGDRLQSADGGMDMWWDTIDMYYSEDSLVNGTVQRVITSQKNPLNIPQDPPYFIEVIVDRGANVAASTKVTPSIEHVGFEFAEFNVTSNVRRYRFHYKPEQGAARPTWRGWSDIYVPSGDFFPIKRVTPNTVVPPIGTD